MIKQKTNKKDAYTALFISTLALIINFWAWSLLSPLGAKYAHELSLQPTGLALLLAIPVIVGALGRIVFGMLTDKYGGKTMFSIVCFLTAIPVVGLIFVQSYTELLLVALLLGLGGAAFAIGVPYISSWFPPEKRGLAIGIYSMGNAGTAVSGFLTPQLESVVGRNETFLIVAILLALMGIVFVFFAKSSPKWKPPKGSSWNRMVEATKQGITWDLSVVYAVSFGAFVAFGVYLPVLLKVAYDLSLTDAASRAAGFVLLATIARPIGGWLSDKIGGQSVVRLGLIAIILLAGFVALQNSLTIHTTVAYLSLAVVLGCCNGAVFALVGKMTKPEFMGSTTGIIGAVGGLGGFLPPLVLGVTYQLTNSYSVALAALSISAMIVLVYIHARFKNITAYRDA